MGIERKIGKLTEVQVGLTITSEKLSGYTVKPTYIWSIYMTVSFSVFRQGDIGTNWYAVLAGSLDVKVSETSSHQVRSLFSFFFLK